MKARVTGVAIGVALVALSLFWPAVRNGITYWDDWGYLQLADQHRLSWGGIKWAFTNTFIYYQPLTWLSHGLDCAWWGLNPAGHHAQSVVWHAFNAMLVTGLAWQLSKWAAPWTETERLFFAGWVGIVFAVHPLQVEAVVWLAGRKTVLAAFFSLLSLMAYVHWANVEHERRWWWAMMAGYVAALLSKPMAVSLPAVMVALDVFPLRRVAAHGWWRLFREKWLLFLLAAVVGVLTIIGQTRTGAVGVIQLGLVERVLVATRSFVFYLWKLVWPAWLSPFYPLGEWNNFRQAEFIFPLVVCVIVTGVVLVLWRRAPQLAAGWAAYLALVLPVSGILQAGGQAVADRFAYLPIVAALLLAGGGLVWVRRQLTGLARGLLALAVGGFVVWFAARTQEQIPVWHDEASLWQEVVARVAASTTEYGYAAAALTRQGRVDEALPYAEQAYQRLTADADSREQVGMVYRNLVVAFVELHRLRASVPLGQRAVELLPDDAIAHAALGLAYLKTSQYAAAVGHLERALTMQANLPATRYNLACAYARLERWPAALVALEQAIAAMPTAANSAARDAELAGLRAHLEFGPKLVELLRSAPQN